MQFSDLAINDRFASGDNPNNRLYQKVGEFSAIDRSEGINARGQYIVDRFSKTDTIVLRNDVLLATDYDPSNVIRGEDL